MLSDIVEYLNHLRVPTLSEALDRYTSTISVHKKSGSKPDKSLANIWKRTRLCNKKISKIKPRELVEIRDQWLGERMPGTVMRRFALLSHLYTIGRKEWGYYKIQNPVNLITKPRVVNGRNRRVLDNLKLKGFPKDELSWISSHTRSKEMPLVLTLAVETAMRRSEIVKLLWENVNFEDRTVLIPDTKNGYPRTVPLSPRAVRVLERIKEGKTCFGRIFKSSPGAVTRAFHRSVLRSRIHYESICRGAGLIPDSHPFINLHLHDLRHEAISRLSPLFQAHELAAISGHRDTRMLMRYYHPNASDLAKRLLKME